MTQKYTKEYQYILDSIDGSNYDLNLVTDKEKLQFLYNTFRSEYGFAIKQKGEFAAMTEWLQGLPSCVNISFYNHDIIALAKEWGALPEKPTSKQEDKILARYWPFMAMRIYGLFRKYKISQ